MKQILLTLLCLVAIIPLHAQKILSDDTANGTRSIITSKENVKSGNDRVVIYAGLSLMQSDGEPHYFLSLKLSAMKHLAISKENRILLKDQNGEVITLTTPQGSYGADTRNVGGFNLYEINVDYPVAMEQLQQLANGVTKIRIELDNDEPFEKDYKKDKIGKVIQTDLSLIAGALGTDKKASFSDGF